MLTEDDANTLACAFVHSKLDYGNALLYNTSNENLKKMQRLQNALARVVKQAPRRSPSLPILKQLHWLPVKARINFKIASLTYKVLNTGEPVQLRELLKNYSSTREQRQRYVNTLVKPRTHLTLSDKSFSIAAPEVWNNLSIDLRTESSYSRFHKSLKSALFNSTFD